MKAQWTEGSYGLFYFLRLPGGFTVTVGWESTKPKNDTTPNGYRVSFEEATLVKRFTNLEEAMKAGVALAKARLALAQAALTDD